MAKTYVAITGGIGSGKSQALQFLQALNYPVFSCDELYKQVIQSDVYIKKIEDTFPTAVQNGVVDRKILSAIVFNNETMLKQLNDLAHPFIMDLLMKCMAAAEGDIAFAEVPLLFEGNFENLFHHIIYIARDQNERINSILARDNLTLEETKKRVLSQFDGMSNEGKQRLKNCNAKIISNYRSIVELQNEISKIVNTL